MISQGPSKVRIPRGQQQATSEKLRVSSDTVRVMWQRYVENGTLEPKVSRSGVLSKKLGYPDKDLIEHQLLVKPSSSYSDVYRTFQQSAVLPAGTSITAIGNVVRKGLNISYNLRSLPAVKLRSIP